MRCARAACRRARRAASRSEVIGIVSLLVWTLIIIVTLKYVVLILRADNRGEGGTLSLMALAQRAVGAADAGALRARGARRGAVLWRCGDHAGHLGALGGRGTKLVAPGLHAFVIPLTVAIIVALFWVQSAERHGSRSCSDR